MAASAPGGRRVGGTVMARRVRASGSVPSGRGGRYRARVVDPLSTPSSAVVVPEVLPVAAASVLRGDDVDLLFVGAPTQMRGLRVLAEPFLAGLAERGFAGTPAAAFDTRVDVGPQLLTSTVIADRLAEAGCRLVASPESFLVLGLEGPLADGEAARAGDWAREVVAALAADATT